MERYIKNNRLSIFLAISALLTGTVVGAFSLTKLDSNSADTICQSINESIANIDLFSSFLKSVSNEFTRFIILFLCGIMVFGTSAIIGFLGFIGYSLGFSAGFLLKYYGLAGFLSVLFGIVPHYIILLPTYIVIGIVGINFSNNLIFGRKQLKNDLKLYTAKMIFFAVLIFLSCIIEGFISSFIIKKIFLTI